MYGIINYTGTSDDPSTGKVTRSVVEVIAPHNGVALQAKRDVVEVVHALAFTLPVPQPRSTREIVEVLGSVSAYDGYRTKISRAVLEAIGSADLLRKEFLLDVPITTTTPTIFVVLDTTGWDTSNARVEWRGPSGSLLQIASFGTTPGSGQLGISYVGASSAGSWGAADAGMPEGKHVVMLETSATPATASWKVDNVTKFAGFGSGTWTPTTFDRFGAARDFQFPNSGHIAEVMWFDRTLTAAEKTYVHAYLRCKWITPGCNPLTDIGPAP